MAEGTSAAVSATDTKSTLVENDSHIQRPFSIVPTNGTIYIGGAGLTVSTGIPVKQDVYVDGILDPHEVLSVITATGTVDVRTFVGVGTVQG